MVFLKFEDINISTVLEETISILPTIRKCDIIFLKVRWRWMH
jgi:hypothetical protein